MTSTGWAVTGGGWGALAIALVLAWSKINARLSILEERTRDKKP